VRVKSDT